MPSLSGSLHTSAVVVLLINNIYMQRLVIVFNPRSSRFSDVEKNVLTPAKSLKGYLIGKYEVEKTNLEDNITKLAKLIQDGDLVISAGGDATGIIASNAVIKSGKDATLAVLPYGNFNDLSRTLGTKTLEDATSKNIQKFYPLEIIVDDKFFRYATCYITIGMMADSVQIYDQPKMRKKLKKSFGRKISSYTDLACWYFKNRRKKQFLPDFKLNGKLQPKNTSDYAAINGRFLARVLKSRPYYQNPRIFLHETDRLTNFYRLSRLILKSLFSHVPSSETKGDVLEFLEPGIIKIQAEGESRAFKNAKKIEIKKSDKFIKVIHK